MINKTLMTLSAILETAEERELIGRNPAAGKRRRVRVRKPRRTWLDTTDQVAALLDAAGELDAEAREDRKAVARRTMLATLTFSGLRIGELLDLQWRNVDLAAGRVRVGNAKTEAGLRDIRMLPVVREELATLKAAAMNTKPTAYVFATLAGGKQSPSNVRNRGLAKAVERANERLERAERTLCVHPLGPL